MKTKSILLSLTLVVLSLTGYGQVDDSYYRQFDSTERAENSGAKSRLLVDSSTVDSLSWMRAQGAFNKQEWYRAIGYFQDYTLHFLNSDSVPSAYLKMAQGYLSLGDREQARGLFENAMLHSRSKVSDKAARALLPMYRESKRSDTLMLKVLCLNEPFAATPGELANLRRDELRIAKSLEQPELIVAYAQRMLSTPGLPEGLKLYANYQLAYALYGLGRYDEAYTAFDAVSNEPGVESSAEAMFRKVEIRYIQKDWQGVKTDALAAGRMKTTYQYWVGRSYILLARAYQEQNQIPEARSILKSLVQRYINETDGVVSEAEAGLAALAEGRTDWYKGQ